MRKIFVALFLLAVVGTAEAQSLKKGTISTAAATCALPTTCTELDNLKDLPSFGVYIDVGVSGTFNFEATILRDASNNDVWFAVPDDINGATTQTADGFRAFSNPGYRKFRIRASAISGDANFEIYKGAAGLRSTATLSGAAQGDGAIQDGASAAIEATVLDLASSNPIAVSCSDPTTGAAVSCGAAGLTDTDDGSIATGQTPGLTAALNMAYDGTVWRRLTFGVAGTASAQVLTVQGIASMTPILSTLTGTNNIATVSTVTAVTGVTNPVTVTGATTPTDNFANPTTAIPVMSFGMCWDGSTWDRCTGAGADTELPAAAAITDNFANPTVPGVMSFGMCWDGSAWDRCAGTAADTELPAAAAAADNMANPTAPFVLSANMCWDGTTWDRCPTSSGGSGTVDANTARTVLATDVPLPAGTNILGALVANQSVNVAQINGVTPLMGAGATGTGSHRVTEANDSQLSAGVGATGDAAATVGSTGSLSAKQRLMTSQLDAIQTALQLIDNSQTGDSVHYRTSVGTTEDEHEVKATPGVLYSVAITNTNAAPRYWRCYNLTAANTTPGSSTVFIGLAVPGDASGRGFTHTFGPNGIAFSTALTCAFTTGAADTDVAEVAANEIKVTYSYK